MREGRSRNVFVVGKDGQTVLDVVNDIGRKQVLALKPKQCLSKSDYYDQIISEYAFCLRFRPLLLPQPLFYFTAYVDYRIN